MTQTAPDADSIEARARQLLGQMTLGREDRADEASSTFPKKDRTASSVRPWAAGRVGSIINSVDTGVVNELQRLAVEESRLGIPLLVGRDVIHGFKTIMPIPLGQAATWNPDVVRNGARIAASEAAAVGINWTFAPMIDISRDPRWGRVAESLGEDPCLTSVLGVAMVEGFQNRDLESPQAIAACAKHFAGYGASEGGRDYSAANIPERELRNVYLPPFRAAAGAGVATFMASFSDLNGVPASGSEFLMRQVPARGMGPTTASSSATGTRYANCRFTA